jgi:hypothetical protein
VEAKDELSSRQQLLREFDEAGLMATPRNSSHNERVIEAARKSIVNGGRLIPVASDPESASHHG